MRTLRMVLGLALGCGVLGACLARTAAGEAAAEKQSLVIQGSTTVGPIADAFAEAFMRKYPGLAITVKKTGSGDGAKAIVDGQCDVATMSRFMKEKEYQAAVEKGFLPVAHVVAMDGVCVVVHPSNPVAALTTAQVRDIYAGKIINWKDLGGPDAKIVFISRDTSSGTYETFNELVMHGEKIAAACEYVTSNPEMHGRVSTTPGAVGYVGLGFADEKVKVLKVDGVLPGRKTIASGVYPIARPLYLFTRNFPRLGSIVHAFCTFHLTEEGQEIIEAKGFVPVTSY